MLRGLGVPGEQAAFSRPARHGGGRATQPYRGALCSSPGQGSRWHSTLLAKPRQTGPVRTPGRAPHLPQRGLCSVSPDWKVLSAHHLDRLFSLCGTLQCHLIREFSHGPESYDLTCYLHGFHRCLNSVFICLYG